MATPTSKFYLLKGNTYIGRVRMFFNKEFTYHPKLNTNSSIVLDVNAITTSFENLRFKVDPPIVNKTKNEMIEYFNEDIDYFGCAVIFVFSHGEQDFIYGVDFEEGTENGKINVWNDYYNYFSGDKKPEMQMCPKVFFNEWCQSMGDSTSTVNVTKEITEIFRNTAHWLIYNAAQPNYEAYFDPENGSYSTQAFCQRLNECAQTLDLEDILTLVKKDIYGVEVHPHKYLQPILYSSLVAKLYLLPEEKVYQLTSTYRKEFEHIGVIGKGKFGAVFKARKVKNNINYAIKRIQLVENTTAEQKRIQNEFKMLATLSEHKKIVRYYHEWFESNEFEYQWKSDSQLKIYGLSQSDSIVHLCYIQMELCGESLEQWLKDNSQRDKVKSIYIFKQIIQGLAYIHKNGVVHRDVKPSNILFAITNKESDLSIRIADFGISKSVDNLTTTVTAGTLLYMAPEMGQNKYDKKSDMYSAGLMLIELLCNCNEDHEEKLSKAKDQIFPESFENELEFAVGTLRKLLSVTSTDRLSSDEMLHILCTDPHWNEEWKSTTTREESVYRKEFQHIGVLGSGKFGVVLQARNLKESVDYAIKRIQLFEYTKSEEKRIVNEYQSLAKLTNCPFIVRYHRVWNERADFNLQVKEDDNWKIGGLLKTTSSIIHFCFIQMEICGETLEFYLKNNSARDKVKSLNIFKQIVQGLDFLHGRHTAHGDIKPSNILFAITNEESEPCVRIADFGLVRNIDNFYTTQGAGTLLYLAPEIIFNQYGTKSDMYSAGLILIELLYDCSGENHSRILYDAKLHNFPEAFKKELKFASSTLRELLATNPKERPRSHEMLKTLCTHPDWITNMIPETKTNLQLQDDWHLESTCTAEEHVLQSVSELSTSNTLTWNRENDTSEYFVLPTSAGSNTLWSVKFNCDASSHFGVLVRCQTLDKLFRAASVRLFASVERTAVWMEGAAILKSGEEVHLGYFLKTMTKNEICKSTVRVFVRWSELDQLQCIPNFSDDAAGLIKCRWQLHKWKSVTPTDVWSLYSEPFGRNGALWRIAVDYRPFNNDRKVIVRLILQHVPKSINWSGLSSFSSLSLWGVHFVEQQKSIAQGENTKFTAVESVTNESRDPLNLNVIIRIGKIKK